MVLTTALLLSIHTRNLTWASTRLWRSAQFRPWITWYTLTSLQLDDEGFDLGSTTSLSFSSASSDDDAYLTARTYSTENMHRSLTTAASVVAETSQQELQPTIAMPVDDNCRVE